jgi:hypothetical protein
MMNCGLPIADCGLPIADCGLPIADCGLPERGTWTSREPADLEVCATL